MVEKKILLLGSGFVAGPCAEYLLRRPENRLTIASRRVANAAAFVAKLRSANKINAVAISLDVSDEAALNAAVEKHDIIISLIPYTQHALVFKSALKFKKHVVTTSYISPVMEEFNESAKAAGITFLNEIGLDPGIDHLYAVKTIKEVHDNGGKITSFLSYCGGLPAPEASNNPLGYKFSWSSRGVLLALRNSAKFIEGGKVVEIPGEKLMTAAKPIYIYPAFAFVGYPNRDSTPYDKRYLIPEAQNVVRGTLRYQGFPEFVKSLVQIGFLSDTSLDWLAPSVQPLPWKVITSRALGVQTTSEQDLINVILSKTGLEGDEASRIINGLRWLIGLFSNEPAIHRGTLLDTLCATLEEKMQYGPGERDMVMLQHKFGVELADGKKQTRTSTGLWFGVPGGDSAMATTVGVPCAIATQMILDEKIKQRGVLAPLSADLVYPLIEAIEAEGIIMEEAIL
ncbi:saccharopine dehydrogenase (NADP+, L-glutamate-forming) [Nowakowskiella sp. JEL0078]|nr:saccharopine dehydrogenase (NADP+, L-glutamate-forming) [Nowakowskiella sp. JEL0078]